MILNRVLWLVETRLSQPITLQGMAAELGVSPEWLTRSFSSAYGQTFMRYVWRRRLSRAALQLAGGQDQVITVALDSGYGSPEAFARAFRGAFGETPRDIIRRGATDGLPLQPALETKPMNRLNLTPVIETMPERRIVGLRRRYTMETRMAIPGQWAEYNGGGHELSDAVPDAWYGVCADFGEDGSFDYLCGQEAPRAAVPAGWSAITLPAGRWARFATTAHISAMQEMWGEIYREWMGKDRMTPRDGPSTEYYPASFDGATGEGGYEIWVPVA